MEDKHNTNPRSFKKTTGGVRILQTKQIRYFEGTTDINMTQDGNYVKYINSVIRSEASGMQVVAPGARGNVKITIDYVIDQGDTSTSDKGILSLIYKRVCHFQTF